VRRRMGDYVAGQLSRGGRTPWDGEKGKKRKERRRLIIIIIIIIIIMGCDIL
jgi:hypothetical protein